MSSLVKFGRNKLNKQTNKQTNKQLTQIVTVFQLSYEIISWRQVYFCLLQLLFAALQTYILYTSCLGNRYLVHYLSCSVNGYLEHYLSCAVNGYIVHYLSWKQISCTLPVLETDILNTICLGNRYLEHHLSCAVNRYLEHYLSCFVITVCFYQNQKWITLSIGRGLKD